MTAPGRHHVPDGKDFSRVAMQPSPRPVFITEGQFEHLYIRTGNSTRLLTDNPPAPGLGKRLSGRRLE
jgi:hypothetical protein